MSLKASITSDGAVLLGTHIACDAFDDARPIRVVTHAHADHMTGLQQSLKLCEKVLMTLATKDLIDVMMGPLFLMRGNVETIEYGRSLTFEDERLTFYPVNHILGAAQVLVEDIEGTRILYTGDFKLRETPIVETDILVMEATYGNPSRVRHFEKEVETILISLVEQELQHGPVYIFGYHGKLQEVMQILYQAKVKTPFVVPEKVFHVSKVCEKHGMRFGRYILSFDSEAGAMTEKGEPFVAFYHMGSKKSVSRDVFRIYVSGWEFTSPCRKISEKEFVIALSDHSDFNGLIQYVRASKPKYVVTDNYRVGHAAALAREIRKRLGISAKPLPP